MQFTASPWTGCTANKAAANNAISLLEINNAGILAFFKRTLPTLKKRKLFKT